MILKIVVFNNRLLYNVKKEKNALKFKNSINYNTTLGKIIAIDCINESHYIKRNS